MSFLTWFSKKNSTTERQPSTQGEASFLNGKTDALVSADIDPEGAEKLAVYEKAMSLKKAGNVRDAADMLFNLCATPNIYKGHYKELFKIWRQFNREDIKHGNYQDVVDRVVTMSRLDIELKDKLLKHLGGVQNRRLPNDDFGEHINLLVSDAKSLKKAAGKLGLKSIEILADGIIASFDSGNRK